MDQADVEALLEQSVEIDAPVGRVWELVSDVCRMPEWSPQVRSTRLRAGHDHIGVGAQFTSRNGHGELEWTTHGEVTRHLPEQELAFRIEENWVVWSFLLEPTASGGTHLTQRRAAPEGISELSRELTDGFMGGQAAFTATMREGMLETLARLKAEAES